MRIDQASSRRRLLVLTSTFPRWEDDREPAFVYELCRRLADEFDVIVLAPHASGAAFREKIGGLHIRRFPYFFPRWEMLAYEGGIVANLRKHRWNYLVAPLFLSAEFLLTLYLIKKYRVDAIHAHWIIPQGSLAAIASKCTWPRPPIACTMHGSDLFSLQGRLFSSVKRWTARSVDHFTVVSQAMHEPAAALGGKGAISIIPMGVDLQMRFTPPPPTAERNSHELLCVGRLVTGKGIRYIIEALPRVLEKYPQIRLVIVGDGPERNNLMTLAANLELESCIEFTGALNHAKLADRYRQATLLVSASLQEGFGLVFAEAMGCECPVLAADLPSISDIVKDGITGTVCKQQDSADLAEKILLRLDHPESTRALAKAARQYVLAHFDWNIIAERYRLTIEAMCEKAR